MWDGSGWEIWAIAALAGLVGMLLVRSSSRWRGLALRILMLAVAVTAVAGFYRWQAARDLAVERRAVQARQAELAIRAIAPGSALACLDGDAGETVEAACEKALFATPAATAAAVTYVTARLALLSDALSLGDDELAPMIAGLRRALELDRYGVAAHVLATRDGCSVEDCAAFAWVEDATALKANLKAGAFDAYVQRHEAAWKNKPEPVAAPAAPVAPQAEAAPPEPPPIQPSFSSRYDFPSSDSIPAVSIMNKEPPRPPEGEAVAPQDPQKEQQSSHDAPAPSLPVPPKRPQTQGAAPR